MLLLGLLLLFFLPVIESFDRSLAFLFLCSGALLISFPLFWKKKISFDLISLFFVLFIIRGLISTFFSWSMARSIIEVARYCAYFLIFTTIREDIRIRNIAVNYLTLFLTVNCFLLSSLYLIFFFGGSFLPPVTLGMNLFYPVFGHNRIADLLILAIPLLIGLSFQVKDLKWKLYIKIFQRYFLILLLISLGRGAWWSIISAIFICIKLFPQLKANFRNIKHMAGVFFAGVIFMTLAIFINSQFPINKYRDMNSLKGFFKPLNYEKRPDYFTQAVKGFLVSPLTGTGLDTFRYVSQIYQRQSLSWSWYAHNHLLQIMNETGIIGSVAFLILFILLFRESFKRLNGSSNSMKHWIFMAITASSIHSLIDFDWQFISVLLFVFAGFAVLLPMQTEEKDTSARLGFAMLTVLMVIGTILSFMNSEFMLKKADKFVRSGEENEALSVLKTAAGLDSHNGEIYAKSGQIYERLGESQKAHFNYQKAISLNPLEAEGIKIDDYLLYLDEAENMIKNNQRFKTYEIIEKSINQYPDYFQNNDLEWMLSKNLEGYIKEMKRRIKEVKNRV